MKYILHGNRIHSWWHIPGWNKVCMNLHHEARESFLMWKANGKPRTGPIHELMKISKTKFKYGLRQCKKDAASHVSNKLAHSLLTKDSKAFWKGIKSIYTNKTGDCLFICLSVRLWTAKPQGLTGWNLEDRCKIARWWMWARCRWPQTSS